MISKLNIENLFDQLWPGMLYVKEHKINCLNKLETINKMFTDYSYDHNVLISKLCLIDGIKTTIASGIIWSKFPYYRVPFDKYTLTYALNLKIINSNNVLKNYVTYSNKITEYCNGYTIEERPYLIEDFVREALLELENSEYLCDVI